MPDLLKVRRLECMSDQLVIVNSDEVECVSLSCFRARFCHRPLQFIDLYERKGYYSLYCLRYGSNYGSKQVHNHRVKGFLAIQRCPNIVAARIAKLSVKLQSLRAVIEVASCLLSETENRGNVEAFLLLLRID